jgi:predicted nucleotidyltransferase
MDLSLAVAQTKAYAGYFNFPLSPSEIHYWLISPHPVSQKAISKYLSALTPRELSQRKTLNLITKQKEKTTLRFLKYAKHIPGIRLIALTGSIAANNSRPNDDLDLLIITRAHTLWLVRPILLLLLSTLFNRRHPGDSPTKTKNAFCPNLWLDSLSLSLPKNRQNLYTAHETLQIKPLLDRGHTHQLFINSNRWAGHFLANAYQALSQKNKNSNPRVSLSILLSPLNYLSFLLQYLYMLPKKTTETVSLHSAFFHKNNLSVSLEKHLQNNSL